MEREAGTIESVSDVSYLIARYKLARRRNEEDLLNAVSGRLKEIGVWEDRAIQQILGLSNAAS